MTTQTANPVAIASKAPMTLSGIALGAGATNAQAVVALLEALVRQIQASLELQQKQALSQQQIADVEGEAAKNAMEDTAKATFASGMGQVVGSGAGLTLEGFATYKNNAGSDIETHNNTAKDMENRETAIKKVMANPNDPSFGAANNNGSPMANSKKLNGDEALAKFKGKEPFQGNMEEHALSMTSKQRKEALKSVQQEQRDAKSAVQMAQNDRSYAANNFRTVAQATTGLGSGAGALQNSKEQESEAQWQKTKTEAAAAAQLMSSANQGAASIGDAAAQKLQNTLQNLDASLYKA